MGMSVGSSFHTLGDGEFEYSLLEQNIASNQHAVCFHDQAENWPCKVCNWTTVFDPSMDRSVLEIYWKIQTTISLVCLTATSLSSFPALLVSHFKIIQSETGNRRNIIR